jgi:hypothetical protein
MGGLIKSSIKLMLSGVLRLIVKHIFTLKTEENWVWGLAEDRG